MSRPDNTPAAGSRQRATTRPVSVELDREGTQLLASAASANTTVAVYANQDATAAELVDILSDLRIDLPVQGRRIGIFEPVDAANWSGDRPQSDPTDGRLTHEHDN